MENNSSLREIVEGAHELFGGFAYRVQSVGNFQYQLDIQDGNYPPNFSVSDSSALRTRVVGELIQNAFKSVFGVSDLLEIKRLVENKKLPNSPSIRVGLETNSDQYGISVCDNGPGIPEEILYRIWDRGFSTFGTSGIGLDIMKCEVEDAFGCRIEVKSKPNVETRFSVYIPLNYRS